MIYMDHAATTQMLPEVLDAMMPYLTDWYGNASSKYKIGYKSREAIEEARETIANYINCNPEDVIFTSGGSEADNQAILKSYNTCVLTSSIEHHAVLHSAGYSGRFFLIPPDPTGHILVKEVKEVVDRHLIDLVSIMMVNNEVGTIQPIKEIAMVCNEYGARFHTDAVQAFPHMRIDTKDLGIDYMSVSTHKFGGPKGIGFLYSRRPVASLIHGGGQEMGRRAGTENVAGIVGMAKAVEILDKTLEEKEERIRELSDHFKVKLFDIGCEINGSGEMLPSHINVWIKGMDNQQLLAALDEEDICASAGSACNAGNPEPSYVLKSMGYSDKRCNESIRFTLGSENTFEEIDKVIEVIKTCRALWS